MDTNKQPSNPGNASADAMPIASADPDVDTLERARSGDQDAFAELFDRHSGIVLGVLMKILARRSLAEEVLQETFLQVWEQAERFDPSRGRVRSWILTIARSRALDRIRSATSRTKREHATHDQEQHLGRHISEPEGSRRIEFQETSEELARALSTLPDPQRECIRLSFIEGMTHSELAKHLQTPLGTVKSRIRFGLMKLKGSLQAA